LRELLRGVEFQQAILVVEAIGAKTADRMMYDQAGERTFVDMDTFLATF
jgi:hypothetical protein